MGAGGAGCIASTFAFRHAEIISALQMRPVNDFNKIEAFEKHRRHTTAPEEVCLGVGTLVVGVGIGDVESKLVIHHGWLKVGNVAAEIAETLPHCKASISS